MLNFLDGTGVALVTPYTQNGSLDLSGLEKLVNHVIAGGVEYLVILGTTGETATLSATEKEEVLHKIIEINQSRVPLVLGIGGNNTAEICHQLKKNNRKEIAAVLSVSPYYNKPSQEGIYQHYKALAQETSKPILLYNVPGRTGSNISAETSLRIAHTLPQVIGIKEASGNMEQIMYILNHKPKDFKVISGDDTITLPIIAAGGTGVISVVANGIPGKFSEMVRLCLNNNFPEARNLHYQLLDLVNLLFAEGNPAGVKAVLNQLNICEPWVRLPLVSASENLVFKIREELVKLGQD
jgi:4-hydroxy-tetrahydrodipicolinate synthase